MADHSETSSSPSATASHQPSSSPPPATFPPLSRFSSKFKDFKKIFTPSHEDLPDSTTPLSSSATPSDPSHSSSSSSRLKGFFKSLPSQLKKLYKFKNSVSGDLGMLSKKPFIPDETSNRYSQYPTTDSSFGGGLLKKPMNAKLSASEISEEARMIRQDLAKKAIIDRIDKRISRKNPPNYNFESKPSRLSSSTSTSVAAADYNFRQEEKKSNKFPYCFSCFRKG